MYAWVYLKEVWHLCHEAGAITKEASMLLIVELIDMAMIANLVRMIVAGSYTSFVNKNHGEHSEKASSGTLKAKMATSLIGISSIHLLQTFIEHGFVYDGHLLGQLLIHVSFIIGAMALMWIEYIHVKAEVLEHQLELQTAAAHAKSVPASNHGQSTPQHSIH